LSDQIKKNSVKELERLNLSKLFEKLPEEYLFGEDRFLGLLMAPLLAEILEIKDKKEIIKLGVATSIGRCFIIAEDQMVDRHSEITKELILSTPVLYYDFVRKIRELVNNEDLNKKIDEITLDMMKGNSIYRSTTNIEDIALNVAIVKIPAITAAYMANKPELRDKIATVSYKFAVAVGLTDFICDIEEDTKIGIESTPIVWGLIKNGKISTDVLNRIVDCSILKLEEAKKIVYGINKNDVLLKEYFDRLIENIKNAKENVKSVEDLNKFDNRLLQKNLLKKPIGL
jgi:hypothetical protein